MVNGECVPIFSLRLAAYLMEQGYILDHTDTNKKDSRLKVYYFRLAPGIYGDMNGFKHRRDSGMENSTVLVYSRRLAQKLMRVGYRIDHTVKTNTGKKIYHFKPASGIEDMISDYKEGVKRNAER